MKSEIDAEIQKAEGYVKGIRSQIEAEQARLQAFGSKEEFYSFLCKEKGALNALESLKSKRRVAIMQDICDRGIAPLIQKLRDKPTTEPERIEITLELALYLRAIEKIKSNFVVYDRVDEVKFEIIDEGMKMQYGEKREEVTTSTKRTRDDIVDIRDERWILKNPSQTIVISLPYPRAVEMGKLGKGKIIEAGQPAYQERIAEDREPEILPSARRLNLGSPIEIDGKLSDQAKSLGRRAFSGRLELSPVLFGQFVSDREIQRVLKKYE